jgi:RNA polymerase sigma factor (sigma-70 family)
MTTVGSDTELLHNFQRGEEAAVRTLYDLHYRPLVYFAAEILMDQEEAEDIAVDSFLKLLERREGFQSLPSIRSYLYTTVKNACVDVLRRTKSREMNHKVIAELTGPDEQTDNRELIIAKVLEAVHAEIEQLPIQSKRIFTAIFIDGKSTATVAGELGLSPQTVLNVKAKVLQQLRLKLHEAGYQESGLLSLCLILMSLHERV